MYNCTYRVFQDTDALSDHSVAAVMMVKLFTTLNTVVTSFGHRDKLFNIAIYGLVTIETPASECDDLDIRNIHSTS